MELDTTSVQLNKNRNVDENARTVECDEKGRQNACVICIYACSNGNDTLKYVFHVSATSEGDDDETHNHRFVRNCFYKLIKARLLYFVIKRQLKLLNVARSQLKHIKSGMGAKTPKERLHCL
ncbi:hypothetical protein Y032_0004g1929 [Ancylostoma ceylanicum]|uniref:Uncharacterized protein n=1 Tax=Ancylostoma ceylanicum TaxID=53326 RepID=A0A016VUL3_9BILA|nr:hypothetical protein Y032_0004g1929 [Ancylostoma ceylanicum]